MTDVLWGKRKRRHLLPLQLLLLPLLVLHLLLHFLVLLLLLLLLLLLHYSMQPPLQLRQ